MKINSFLVFICVLFGTVTTAAANELESTTYGDWKVSCGGGQQEDFCQMHHAINTGNPAPFVASVTITHQHRRNTYTKFLQVTVPVGVSLRKAIGLQVAEKSGILAQYSWCLPDACWADVALTDEDVTSIANSTSATLRFFDAKFKPISLPVSLRGFSDAWAAMNP